MLSLFGCGPSLPVLKTKAVAGEVNGEAPVKSRLHIDIEAPPKRVWEVLSGIDRWPAWHAKISKAKLEGALAEGSRFRWKTGGVTINSELAAVKPDSLLGWTGTMMGMKAIHLWRLVPLENGSTRVVVEESLDGFAVGLMFSDKKLTEILDVWLVRLKKESEAAPAAEPAQGPGGSRPL